MKIIDLFSQVEAMRPSAYDNNTKLIWLNEVEGIIQNEVFLFSDEDFIVYGEDDLELEPLLDRGFEKIYRAYLMAMISLTDGEFKRYQNDMQIFNRYYSDFCTYYKTRNTAAQGYSTAYVSAYAIAVKHGLFSGDEEAFIGFLKGEKGDTGAQGKKGDKGDKGDTGVSGVYIGSGDMPDDCNVQIDPNGDAFTLDEELGDVETALDAIIALQNSRIGGEA